MFPEEETSWGWQAYRYGELLSEGPVPVPQEMVDQATEIRWIANEPVPEPPYEAPLPAPAGEPLPGETPFSNE